MCEARLGLRNEQGRGLMSGLVLAIEEIEAALRAVFAFHGATRLTEAKIRVGLTHS
jgi:hypothetical protein